MEVITLSFKAFLLMFRILEKISFLIAFLFFSSCIDYTQVEHYELPNPYPVEITGDNYEWHFRFPGKDGKFQTSDDVLTIQNIKLPQNIDVEFQLLSKDYLYTMELPELRQIAMAVPDMRHTLVFRTTQKGIYKIKGDQMCGYTHESLFGKLTVESPNQFFYWLSKQN